jgi:3-oxoacyl-[acyl-carrier-protein] synthase III
MYSGPIYLKGLAYTLGDAHDIGELEELRTDPDTLEMLRELGLKSYRKHASTPVEMAGLALRQTLDSAALDGQTIDALIYATNSFWDPEFYRKGEISRLLSRLGVSQAYPLGLFFSECANLQTALRVAASLIRAGECKRVLVVATDKTAESETRLVPPSISVKSDAAASCLVSAEVPGDFEVVFTGQHFNAEAGKIDPHRQVMYYMQSMIEGLSITWEKVRAFTDVKPEDFRQLISNNYNLSVIRTICELLQFEPGQLYTKNIARLAHAIAADNLVNLLDYSKEEKINAGELIMLLGTGPAMWGATVLRKC